MMIELTKELRALKSPDGIMNIGSPKDIYIDPEDVLLIEPIKYPWGMGTHIMIRAGGNPMTFVVQESPKDILDKIKFASF